MSIPRSSQLEEILHPIQHTSLKIENKYKYGKHICGQFAGRYHQTRHF